MAIDCELPVDAGRAGRRLLAVSRIVPAVGVLSCALLLFQGSPVWAEAWLTGTALRLAQTVLMTAGLAGVVWAWQALSERSKPSKTSAGAWPGRQRLKLEQSGLARLGDEVLRLDSACSLPGLIVAVFDPISAPGPKLASESASELASDLAAGTAKPMSWLAGKRSRVLLIGRDTLTQDQWRRLHVWLLWVQRSAR